MQPPRGELREDVLLTMRVLERVVVVGDGPAVTHVCPSNGSAKAQHQVGVELQKVWFTPDAVGLP